MGRLVKCASDVVINADDVSTIVWDRGHSYTAMIVTMTNGNQVRLLHQPHAMDGTDCYLIEAKLPDAAAC